MGLLAPTSTRAAPCERPRSTTDWTDRTEVKALFG